MNDLKKLLNEKEFKIEICEQTNTYTICVVHEMGMWNCNENKHDVALHYIIFDSKGGFYYDSYDLDVINEVKEEL